MKKNFFKIFFLLPFFAAYGQVQDYIYKNDFSDPLINEKEGKREGHSISLKNGYLYCEQTKENFYWCIAERLFIDLDKDYEIEMKMKPYNNDAYFSEFGVLFGLRNVSMFNSFTVSGSGLARVASRVVDNDIPYLNPTVVPGYSPGDWCVFRIVRKADKLSFYVNNHLMFEKKKLDMFGRWFGWYTNSKMGLQLDYFYVKQNRGTINLVSNAADYKKERLKGPVNTEKDDVCPVLSADGQQLYYGTFINPSSDFYYVSKEGTLSLNSSAIDTSGKTSGTIKAKTYLSQPWYFASVPDNKGFYAGEKDNFMAPSGMSVAYFNAVTGAGDPAKNVKFAPGNNVTIKHASISADEKVMIISGYENYEPRGLDLYLSTKAGSTWSVPKKIATLNTKGDELTPFISRDMKQLYFSSDGHPGYGFSDVFVANRLDGTWESWSKPQNLGRGVNDEAYNEYFMLPDTAVSNYAFMSSTHGNINNLDIYRVKIKETPPPLPSLILLKGKIVYGEGEAHDIKSIEIILKDKDKTKEKLAVEKSGDKFSMELEKDEEFSLRLLDTNYIITEIKELTALGKNKERLVEVKVARIKRGESFVLENIYFSPNKFDLLSTSYASLDALANAMKNNPKLKIEVQGHTSKTSEGEAFNMELSTNRAQAVKEYLLSKGIGSTRIISKGYGYSKPLYTDGDEGHQAKNRRVEVKVLEK
jgi:OmpA-OmpF porin, OOP family